MRKKTVRARVAACAAVALIPLLTAATPCVARADSADSLPVREITVFKDGHAFVLREGDLPVQAGGMVTMTDLPNPILGTFWPYSRQSGVRLQSVTAERHREPQQQTANTIAEMVEANVGADAIVREADNVAYKAKILAIRKPAPPDEDPAVQAVAMAGGFSPAASPAAVAPTTTLVFLQTEVGTKVIRMDRVQDITLLGTAHNTVTNQYWKENLTLRLDGADAGKAAAVGVMYLQKGLRWIPNYKITIDGKGTAHVLLQATLINELTDLNGATINLVIGTPSFTFKDTPDPIGLQDTFARLSRYFQTDARTPGGFANAIVAQNTARASEYYPAGPAAGSDASGGGTPSSLAGEKAEDLYVFTVKSVQLRRNARMVLPVAEFTIPYKDVYTAELLPSAVRTRDGYETFSNNSDMVRLLAQPKVEHRLRFTNTSDYPLTTAPALVLRGERVIAQGMTSYTAHGGESDLTLTNATDISVKRTDKEKVRTPDAMRSNGDVYQRVDMTGDIELRNYRSSPVEIEVTRYVLGGVDAAGQAGMPTALDPFGDDTLPDWLSQYNADRIRFTGLGKITWKQTVPAGGVCLNLGYNWHYFVR